MKDKDKKQIIMEGEIKVLKDTVWRLTTRVYGLEEQIKEMKTKLKMTTAVDSRLVYSQQILASPPTGLYGGRNSRTSAKAALPVPTPSSSKGSPRGKEKDRKQSKSVKFDSTVTYSSSKRGPPGPKSKQRQIAVKKTGGTAATGKISRSLKHQSVITKRGRRATSFKLQPSDEEKEVYFISDSSDDESLLSEKSKKSAKIPEKLKATKNPTKSPPKNPDSAADDFMKVLNETPSGDYGTIEAHEDLIVFPSSDLNISGGDGSISVGQDDDDQLPLKKRRLEALECDAVQTTGFEDDLYRRDLDERVTEDEALREGYASYVHRPPESFKCFFCSQEFPTDEERAMHSRIHAGAPKKP